MKKLDSFKTTPWIWVPTLYFAEGIPYFIVNNISVMMFTRMGVPNGAMSFFTTLLYFPWFLKGLWSPIVDVVKTKRWWIVGMQVLLTAMMILLTLTLPHPDAATIAGGQTSMGIFTLTLILFIIAAFASATHDIAADGYYMLAHSQSSQAAFIGIRSVFYRVASVFGQGVLVYIAGKLEKNGDIPTAWQITLGVSAAIFFLITMYHTFFMPYSKDDKPRIDKTKDSTSNPMKDNLREMGHSFKTFFTKRGVWLAIAFMLLYRLPEGFLIKLCQPFLVHPTAEGGLGLATDVVGTVYGLFGVIALLLGGILGGIYSSRVGLKKSLWVMAACMTLPCLTFVYLAIFQPSNIVIITIALCIEQFGYGFGFTAYMLYMM
ncbi:MAG: MFS transporter, partial [Muribaculaceae bacterium]|nr:MFS transporter [Muribaculaceae bacterium]